MYLPDTLNAPRLCRAGNHFFWVRRISLEGMGIIMAWLDDVLPGERKKYPALSDPASQDALRSWPGVVLLTWLALREHGVSYDEAASTYAFRLEGADLEDKDTKQAFFEHIQLLNVLFGRRRTMDESDGTGQDISETWCAKGMAQLAAEYGLENVGNLSLDQYEWLASSGSVDEYAQYDLQAAIDDLPRRIAAIQAAQANGTMEVLPSTQ